MGNIFSSSDSKAKTPIQPRNEDRIQAAQAHAEEIVPLLEALDKKIQGQVLLAGASEQYHQQRERPFYFNDCNYPSAVVLVKTPEDVGEVIKFMATEVDHKKYKLCVAGGCHSSYCMVDQAIVLDTEQLNECVVDAAAKTIRIGGGAKIRDAHNALKGTGLGFVTGTNPDTGVSGLTLAGGAGYMGGQAGFACDTVTAARVVLPSTGKLVTATDDNEYADLLRALRGGGGNFGVVIEWTFRLYDVSHAMAGNVVHMCPTQASLRTVMTNYAKVMEKGDIPDEASSSFVLPVGAPVFVSLLTLIGHAGLESKDFQYKDLPFFQAVTELGAWFRASNDFKRREYMGEITDMLESVQQRKYGIPLGAMIYSFDQEIRDALLHYARVEYPTKNVTPVIIVFSISGAARRNDGSRSSLRHRQAVAWVIIEANWNPQASPEEIQAVKDWGFNLKRRLIELGGEDGPHNFCDTDGRRVKYLNEEQRTFLEQAKQTYDPENLLTLNRNIMYGSTTD